MKRYVLFLCLFLLCWVTASSEAFTPPSGRFHNIIADNIVTDNLSVRNFNPISLTVQETLDVQGVSSFSDNVNISNKFRVRTDNSYSGTGTATEGAPRVILGMNEPSIDDSGLLITRKIVGNLLFSHGVRDESTFSSTGDSGYASFDAIPVMSGATAYNHIAGYQVRTTYSGSGTLAGLYGFTFQPTLDGSGTADLVYGYRVYNPLGAGPINSLVGIWIDNLTRGGSNNYSIYSNGSQPSYHRGVWQTGSDIIAAGTVTGSNVKTNTVSGSVAIGGGAVEGAAVSTHIGHNAGAGGATGTSNTYLGAFAGQASSSGSKNTLLGAYAGNSLTGDNNVMLGYSAGSSLVGYSNLFFLANSNTLYPLLYGEFANYRLGHRGTFNTRTNTATDNVTVSTCGTYSVQAGSSNMAGTITTNGSACTVSFNAISPYTYAPACVVTPRANVTAYISAISNTSFTVTASGAMTGFSYVCHGLNE